MTIWAAFAYMLIGAWFWKTIILRDVSASDVARCRTESDLIEVCYNQATMQAGERALTLTHLICKGVFILTWPLWLLVGFILARVL